MATAWYCSREDVKAALDVAETARNNAQVDRAVESASRTVEGLLRRRFYPQTATRYFDWPNYQYAAPWRLWLGRDELISVTTLVSGGTTIAASDYFLEPANSGPPYTRLELDRSSSAAFGNGSTPQREIAVTGVFGYSADEVNMGTLSSSLGASDTDTASISWTTARIGVGDIIRIDDERMIITGRTMVDTTQNLQANLTASMADVTVAVTTGSAFAIDEILLLDSERVLVVDVAGNNLTVKRAWDGSVLAAHSGSDIYALTGIEIDRGQLGTTAAAHSSAAVIYRHVVPGLVRELCIAEAINTLQQETSAYARTVGEGENERESSGRGLRDIRAEALAAFGRRSRGRAV